MPDPPRTLDDATGKRREAAVDQAREQALTKSSGTSVPARGAIFVLGKSGHERAGYTSPEAQSLFDLSMKHAKNINLASRDELDLDYDPYEIHIFNTLEELLRKRPNASANRRWYQVIIITHAQAEQPEELTNSIFFGDAEYQALDLQEFAATRAETVRGFRKAINPDATLRIVGCSPASHGPELGIYIRELIGAGGTVVIPRVDVRFTPTGFLGTPEPGTSKVRALKPEEYLEIPAIPAERQRE